MTRQAEMSGKQFQPILMYLVNYQENSQAMLAYGLNSEAALYSDRLTLYKFPIGKPMNTI